MRVLRAAFFFFKNKKISIKTDGEYAAEVCVRKNGRQMDPAVH